MKAQSPYRRTLVIKREIQALEQEAHSIQKASDLDRAIRGLRACARAGITFDFDHINEVCVSGIMVDPEGSRNVPDLWDFKQYHAFITCESDGLQFSIHMDDGTISIQIAYGERIKQTDALTTQLQVVRRFFARYGVKMTANAIKAKRDNHAAELAQMNTLIMTIEG